MRLAGICLIVTFFIICIVLATDFAGYIQTGSNNGAERIERVEYVNEGITASYPKIIAADESVSIDRLNELILEDFNRILQIYSFTPFEPVPTPGQASVILDISYQIKLNNPGIISILYLAAFNSPYAAHPTRLVYTSNIDRKNSKRLTLGDIVRLDTDFAVDFKGWRLVNEKKYPEYIKQGIKDFISGMETETLLSGMKSADIIGSENRLGIFSYLTEDRLGISLGLPNFLGDHAEFEMDYKSLTPYLQPVFIVP